MKIKRLDEIDAKDLSGEFYFESIVREAAHCSLIEESRLKDIMLQCLDLLAYTCEKMTKAQSGSVPIEAAQTLMASNLYTIGLYLKSLPTPMAAVERLKGSAICELYELGRSLVDKECKVAALLYEAVLKTRLRMPNCAYNDTIDKEQGIGAFFFEYDADFQAQESAGSIDYPLYKPITELVGVEYVVEYLQSLYFENVFCGLFDADSIHRTMMGYHSGYADLLINLCEQVLKNALGCSLLGKDCLRLSLTEEDIAFLQRMLLKKTKEQMLTALKAAFDKLCVFAAVSDKVKEYLCSGLPTIAVDVWQACELQTLRTVFVPFIP